MELSADFVLEYSQTLKLSNKDGFTVLEFTRHPDKDLDNIIEFWKYDKRKKDKGKSSWIIEKDLKNLLNVYLSSFPVVEVETKKKNSNKK